MEKWWQLNISQLCEKLSSDPEKGLSPEEASKRLTQYGPNQLREQKGRHPIFLFLDQFRDFIIWVLIGAAILSGFLGEWIDALAILAIVIFNAILGFVQEYRAEKAIVALKKLSTPMAKVIRDGNQMTIPSNEVVPGDIIEIEAGDHIPADSRVLWHTSNFRVEEASLTGESLPVQKNAESIEKPEIPLGERTNMVFAGTSVVSGKARAMVVSTGMQTELGKIADMILTIEHETTPLQKRLEAFGHWIVYLCFAIVAIVFVMELLRGGKLIDIFLTAVSLAVAAIPEGLPAVVTIALALGVQRMVRRHVLIRKLPSVETLGSATVICSDKTGTLTKNEMTVQSLYVGHRVYRVTGVGYNPQGEFFEDDKPLNREEIPLELEKALRCAVLCNGARLFKTEQGYGISGDPTEAALLVAGAKLGIWKEVEEKKYPFVDELPFDSNRKLMSMIRKNGEQWVAFVKGAPDILLQRCDFIEINGSIRPLTEEDRIQIQEANQRFGNEALRVLGLAYRTLDRIEKPFSTEQVENHLVFLGLIAMMDPPREEVKPAILACKTAGIQPVMITGDHKTTAVAVAKALQIFSPETKALTGEELDQIDEATFQQEVKDISVYARVSPEHKLRIVRAWKSRGDVVAMTGDGVNDAPAVKEADIGVAMGITGTDVTKEVSDMVVLDDNFASIVAAVEEGRGIYDNIKKFIYYLLSCNAGEILMMFFSSLLGLPIPLFPIQILWVNLITDGFPALALGVEPLDPHVMERPPRPKDEGIVTKKTIFILLLQGFFIAFTSLLAFILVLKVENEGLARARTAAFIVLAVSQLFHSFNYRHFTESVFKVGFLGNKKLVLATGVSFLLQMAVVYIPFLRTLFKTMPLLWWDWLLVIGLSSCTLWFMELVKWIWRKKGFSPF
ncbi:MAG TPA: calcium-translocating P-type ATPase, SERCA-type [Candidatus Marinimicrobia bacterium]|nr:calcium-translocating P-type ATPase, SERCA-type [Candidatus Neomarinimicrobiota bacterium]